MNASQQLSQAVGLYTTAIADARKALTMGHRNTASHRLDYASKALGIAEELVPHVEAEASETVQSVVDEITSAMDAFAKALAEGNVDEAEAQLSTACQLTSKLGDLLHTGSEATP